MVKTFEQQEVNNITRNQLALKAGDFSGNLITGGTITEFSSTGIKDAATKQSVVVEDDKLTVKTISIETVDGPFTVRGDVKVYGVIDAGAVRTTEMYVHNRYDKQFIEFANPTGEAVGTGFIWTGGDYNRQIVYQKNPDRFFITENIDIPSNRAFLVDGNPVLSSAELGRTVTSSNLQKLGTLKNLVVGGAVNIADVVYYNPVSERFSIGTADGNGVLTVYDNNNDVEIVVTGSQGGRGVIGTFNTKAVDLVTDNQVRISVESNGNITLGREGTDGTITRVYGKVGVGVKNPREQFEVAGNIRWANKLFTVGNAAPTEGNFTQGDIVWNSDPKANSFIGWVCVQGGSPGVWKVFGQIGG